MRLNDRSIRDELRKQAMSVPIPDDMWANISRELDRDAAKAEAKPLAASQARPRSKSLHVRQMLAIGAAAGIFWMMVIPSSAYVDRLKQPDPVPSTPVAAPAVPVTLSYAAPEDISWDIPKIERRKKESQPSFRAPTTDARRPAPEIAIIR